jgi:hypothetical protein
MRLNGFKIMMCGLAAVFLTAPPAHADQIRIRGADPAPTIVVKDGDTLVSDKALVEPKDAAGNIVARPTGLMMDRTSSKWFKLVGATKLRDAGYIAGTGFVYALVDAKPVVVTPPVSVPAPGTTDLLIGINQSGGEFNKAETGALLPNPADLRSYYNAGFTDIFRIPFKMTQVQTAPAKLAAIGATCVELKVVCVWDRHEYDWRKVPNSAPEWKALLALLPASDLMQIGVMNEPAYFDSETITNDYDQFAIEGQQTITNFRAAGITNMIWFCPPQSCAAYRASKGEIGKKACESTVCSLRKLPAKTWVDPLGKTGLEWHRYFDKNGSGGNDYCYPNTDIASAVAYAKSLNMRSLIGEMAFGSDRGYRDTCLAVGKKAIAELRTSGAYAVTWWGGGRGWNKGYLFYTPPVATLPYVKLITAR